jgi:antitoxin HicB
MSEHGSRYSIVIQWSDEDRTYVVSLPEWGDLMHTHGATYEEALQNGKELLAELMALRQEQGRPLPKPQVFAASA